MTESIVPPAREPDALGDGVGIGERRAPPEDLTAAEEHALGSVRLIAAVAVLATATSLADLSVAPAVAGGMTHLALVLLGWWVRQPLQVVLLALLASLLVLAGFALRMEETALQVAAADRVIALLAIAGVAALLVAGKRRRAALRQDNEALRARIREQTAELAITQTHAELANRSRSEFFAKMGHELRTPLNAIIGFSEIIKDEIFGPVGSARYREYMRDIHESGHHLLDLINDLLDIARLEVGKIHLEKDTVEVSDLVRSCIADIGARARDDGVTLEAELPADLPRLRADTRKVRQILINLLSNAIKFTPPGGTVKVSAWSSAEAGYVLRVVDSGIGMALKDIPVALAPFGQVKNELRQRHEGTGLGLPLTKALIELHDGSFDLQSEPGVGTTVTARFPAERVIAVPKVA